MLEHIPDFGMYVIFPGAISGAFLGMVTESDDLTVFCLAVMLIGPVLFVLPLSVEMFLHDPKIPPNHPPTP